MRITNAGKRRLSPLVQRLSVCESRRGVHGLLVTARKQAVGSISSLLAQGAAVNPGIFGEPAKD